MIASAFLAVQVAGFYFIQRRGFFGKLMRALRRFAGNRDWSRWQSRAQAIDLDVQSTYARGAAVMASFILSLLGWIVGTGEVYLIAVLLGTPVSWTNALLLESLGQAIRGAGFAIPGALGVQEAGYLLLGSIGRPAPGCCAGIVAGQACARAAARPAGAAVFASCHALGIRQGQCHPTLSGTLPFIRNILTAGPDN